MCAWSRRPDGRWGDGPASATLVTETSRKPHRCAADPGVAEKSPVVLLSRKGATLAGGSDLGADTVESKPPTPAELAQHLPPDETLIDTGDPAPPGTPPSRRSPAPPPEKNQNPGAFSIHGAPRVYARLREEGRIVRLARGVGYRVATPGLEYAIAPTPGFAPTSRAAATPPRPRSLAALDDPGDPRDGAARWPACGRPRHRVWS